MRFTTGILFLLLFTLLLLISTTENVLSLDWLVDKVPFETTLKKTNRGTLVLSNALVSREFLLEPDFATIDFRDNHTTKSSLLRCVKPEAIITLDGIEYPIGGVLSNAHCAYFNRTLFWTNKTKDPMAFHFKSYDVLQPQAPFKYTPKRHAPSDIVWPPKGIHLKVYFQAPWYAPMPHQYVIVSVNYEMYDGIPLIVKWLEVIDVEQAGDVDLSFISVELLAVNLPWSPMGHYWLYAETNQPGGHGTNVLWNWDTELWTVPGSLPVLLNCTYETDHPIIIPLKGRITSFRVHELVIASSDPERVGLSKHRLVRLLAPHTQENPIFFHMIDSSSPAFRKAIDQLAEVGFEMLIYSFWSGFNMESDDEKYIEEISGKLESQFLTEFNNV
ncbi:unnamed protein product [Didymodactylos carnosus]|uniref:Uncharacterized protein n=1 Tax=Didymodactylos carnosus TaxID=1234261 RepID=A0A8S2PW30_9BILA|nr:unnamed protein product [Didymodactylos carnosus]CAF4072532.1 unnamed protein product [Didymodactylos carnosus]